MGSLGAQAGSSFEFFDPPPPPTPAAPSFDLGDEIVLPNRGAFAHDGTLTVPRNPTPLDLIVLFDTSGSVGPAFGALQAGVQGIIRDLAESGVDVRVALTEYGDHDRRYRRIRDLTVPDRSFQQALRDIEPVGEFEPAYAAMTQLARGDGLPQALDAERVTLDDPLFATEAIVEPIPPGQQVNLRAGSLRLLLHFTNDVPDEETNGPTEADAIAALRESGIQHIGMHPSVVPPSISREEVRDRLVRVSSGTGGVVGRDPVDCDGDGSADLTTGEPLVCTYDRQQVDTSLAPVMRGLVEAVEDRKDVRLAAEASGAAITISPDVHPRVDATADRSLPYRVTFACPDSDDESRHEVVLTASVDGLAGTRRATVTCAAVAAPPPPPPPPPAAAPAPPPPQPQAPVQVAPPGAAPVGAQASQAVANAPALQPGVGIAAVPEQEFQVATVEDRIRDAEEGRDTNHYVVARRRAPAPTVTLLLGAAGLTAAAAAAHEQQRRTQFAQARRGR